ncbi:MAG: segregation/condensation protein A, partial [Clostridia bacterium]|nr:segregation/condensation protein A [Clostridia bacterium]
MEAVTYRLEQFEGPLDLLLTLIHKNKVSITDIPIALICDQYMEYIEGAEELNMDVASEFILMASELMLIKSKMLLPREDEDEEDPRAQLEDALLRYPQAKEAATKLAP